MSHSVMFNAKLHDPQAVALACEMERARGKKVQGPRYVTDYVTTAGKKLAGYVIKLHGWLGEMLCPCDGKNLPVADNFSPYYDNREVDANGNRIDGTGDVHADVLAGRKRPGDDGKWGDIKELDAFAVAYTLALDKIVAQEVGNQVTNLVYNPNGSVDYKIEVPDAIYQSAY